MKKEMPLFCLPSIEWFRALKGVETLEIANYNVFPDNEPQFKKIDFTGINGKQSFTIPLIGESKKGDYKSVRISYQTNWHHQLFNALKTAYGKSPFFEYYDYKIERILKTKHQFLFDLNYEFLDFLLNALKINLEIQLIDKEKYTPVELIIDNTQYYQVFEDKTGFISQLSIIDYLLNMSWMDFHTNI